MEKKITVISWDASYRENECTIKNIVKTDYNDPTGSFEKTTFISKIFLYDEDMNVVGVAKMARPVRKTEDRELTFKIRFDI
jgi:hypothetical protein